MEQSSPRASSAIEDYLKAVYAHTRGGAPASNADLSDRLGVTPASVSAMLKRLDNDGLVALEPYRGALLTDEGEREALRVVRRHRLVETYLVRELGVPWERVHEEAEVLEHAVSDYLIEQIAAKLGHPRFDPHGDPIPDRDLVIDDVETQQLAALDAGSAGTLVRVDDGDPEMLRYLRGQQLEPGARVEVLRHEPFRGSVVVHVDGDERSIAHDLALAMHVRVDA